MHESGIVEELVREVEKVVASNGGVRAVKVEVGVGEHAGFSREHLEQHFRLASQGTMADGAALEMNTRAGDGLTLEGVEVEDA